MSPVDEGLIHAWLDGQLAPEEAVRVERLVATDAAWGTAAAEARGLVAGASRILGALDSAPDAGLDSGVQAAASRGAARTRTRRPYWRAAWVRVAAGVILAAGLGGVLWQRLPQQAGNADATSRVAENSAKATPPIVAGPAGPAGAPVPVAAPRDRATVPPFAPTTVATPGLTMAPAGAAMAAARGGVRLASPPESGAVTAAQIVPPANRPGDASAGAGAAMLKTASTMQDAARERAPLVLMAPQIAERGLDGCWLVTDSTGNGPARDQLLLHFIAPVLSEVSRLAAPPMRSPDKEQRAGPGAVMNTMVSERADSTFSTEWVGAGGRTNAVFARRGDTLSGTTHVTAGAARDSASQIRNFRAVRAACPPR